MSDPSVEPLPSASPEVTRLLIQRAKDGDRAALDELLARIEPLTQAAARRLWPRSVHGYETEDIHQSVIAQLMRGLDKFRGEERAQLVAWFKVALKRRGLDLVRRADGCPVVVGPHADSAVAAAASHQDSPATEAVRTDELSRMRAAVQQLDPQDREAIVEHDLKQVPLAELAVRQGVSLEAMKKRVQRARERLAELIRGDQGPSARLS